MREIVLGPGREGPVRGGHPWIFSGAIERGLDAAEPGELVRVVGRGGAFVAIGYCNPRTTIAVRVLTLQDEPIDHAFLSRRIDAALALRRTMLAPGLDGYRVLNGEGDGLPGVVVDRYAEFLVVQLLTAGAVRLRDDLVAVLVDRFRPRGIFERSEGGVRAEEGLAGARGVLWGEEPPVRVAIEEDGAHFLVDVLHGQKTGFFLDQRESRRQVRALARGRRVLNTFAYTGALAVVAGLGGAEHVVSVDSSRPSLALGELAWSENGLEPRRAEFMVADVFDYLRTEGRKFDLIILDPPPFVRRRRDLTSGLRGYRDINLQALRHLASDGWLLTCSCSQHLRRAQFRDLVMMAAAAAGRPLTLVMEGGHPPDHPVALGHPEGEYLKTFLLRG